MNGYERLVELLLKARITFNICEIADFLLENNVTTLPCKVGDTIYFHKTLCDDKHTVVIKEDVVQSFVINKVETLAIISYNHAISCDNFGKTAFLTREEAEKALKEKNND